MHFKRTHPTQRSNKNLTLSINKIYSRFSEMIRQLKEFGLIEHWKKTEMDKVAKVTTNDNSEAEFKGLTLSNLQVLLLRNHLNINLFTV